MFHVEHNTAFLQEDSHVSANAPSFRVPFLPKQVFKKKDSRCSTWNIFAI